MSSRSRRRAWSRECLRERSRAPRGVVGARLWLLTALVAGAIAATAVPAAARPSVGETTQSVAITDSGFDPPSVEVAAGTTVIWTNNGTASHDVTSTTGLFQSGALAPGQQFQYPFSTAGNYDYSSSADAGLTGRVTVTGDAVAATAPNAQVSTGAPAAAAPTQVTGTPGAFAYTGPAESLGFALLGVAVILLGWGLLAGVGAPLGALEPWRVLAFVDPRRAGFTDELLPRGLWRRSPRRSTQANLLPGASRRGPLSPPARRARRRRPRR